MLLGMELLSIVSSYFLTANFVFDFFSAPFFGKLDVVNFVMCSAFAGCHYLEYRFVSNPSFN